MVSFAAKLASRLCAETLHLPPASPYMPKVPCDCGWELPALGFSIATYFLFFWLNY